METKNLTCPNCGGDIRFSVEKQKTVCEWCGSEFTADELAEAGVGAEVSEGAAEAEETAKAERAKDTAEFADHTSLYVCSSCGAQIITDETTSASECYYCHNPVILQGRLDGKFRPDSIIPFKVTREEAEDIFKRWVKKKWFVPKAFKSQRQLERLAGVYTPFWLADCKINAQLEGEAVIVRSYTSGDWIVTHTKVFYVDRAAYMSYEKLPADGSKKLDDAFMDSVEPYDYTEMSDFNMNYLTGFFADKYDVDKDEVLGRIKRRANDSAMQFLRADMTGYTNVVPKNQSLNIIKTDWKYALLPVWFMTFTYKGKRFDFAVNGQTGKVSGLAPLDGGKLAIVAGILALIGELICYFLPILTG
jgi:DNA-directed RNA polymerase subunit RPC12/RpoP